MSEEIQSEEIAAIQHSFGRPPTWLIRYGITLVFVFILMVLAFSHFISYPDTLSMHAVIHSETAPVSVIAKQTGRIESIYGKHNHAIDSGAMIITIASELNQADLATLKNVLTSFDTLSSPDEIYKVSLRKNLGLGAMSTNYIELVKSIDELKHFYHDGTTDNTVRALNNEIAQTEILIQSLQHQENLYNEALTLKNKKLDRNKYLHSEGVVAAEALEGIQGEVIQDRIQKENYNTTQINLEVRIKQLNTQILTLMNDRQTAMSDRMFHIKQLVSTLRQSIHEYEDAYYIRASMPGTLSYTRYWSINQWVRSGDTIGAITPALDSMHIIIEGQLPALRSGKIRVGQVARVELANYPASEYGVLLAKVTEVSLLPTERTYLTKLELPDGFITTYGKTIPVSQNLSAQVIIETQSYSLLDRFFMGVRDVWKNR